MQLARVGAVLGTATAGGPDASPTVFAALLRCPRWAGLGPGPGLIPRHTRLHHFVRSAAGETVPDGARAGGAPSRHRRPALRLLPRLVQRRSFAARRLLARRISRRPSIASSDVRGARLHQFPGRVGPIAHADCGWQAARGRYSPLPRRDIQLQPHAPGHLFASWRRGGVAEGVGGALLIQSSPVGACLEGTMSASGDLPSIGAPTVAGKCPDRSGETLVKCLHGSAHPLLMDESVGCRSLQALYKCLASVGWR